MRRVLLIALLIIILLVSSVCFFGCGSKEETEIEETETIEVERKNINHELQNAQEQAQPTTESTQTTTGNTGQEGLSEALKKQIYYEVTEGQDKVTNQDPVPADYREQMNAVDTRICQKFGITQEQLDAIVVEGVQNNWPMPTVP